MILMSSLGLSLLAIGGCLLSKTQGAFLFFRLLQGFGCGCFVLSQALVQDIFDSSQRQNIRIYLITFSGICISISPLCGTVFQYAWGWQGSFFIAAALTTLLLLITWRTLKTEGGKAWPPSHPNGIVIKVYQDIHKSNLRILLPDCRAGFYIAFFLHSNIAVDFHHRTGAFRY